MPILTPFSCNLASSSPVDILVRPGGSDNAANYDRRPSFCRRRTSCTEESSSIRHGDCTSSGTFRKYPETYLFSF